MKIPKKQIFRKLSPDRFLAGMGFIGCRKCAKKFTWAAGSDLPFGDHNFAEYAERHLTDCYGVDLEKPKPEPALLQTYA